MLGAKAGSKVMGRVLVTTALVAVACLFVVGSSGVTPDFFDSWADGFGWSKPTGGVTPDFFDSWADGFGSGGVTPDFFDSWADGFGSGDVTPDFFDSWAD
ncbi:MAG: hypothetical protein ACP5HG_13630 [Anaerolineae bacterium]